MTLYGNVLRHGAGEFGSRIPLVVLEVVLARLLGPAVYGLWSILQTAMLYGNFLHFGVVSSLVRKEPGLHQRNELAELEAVRAATYGFQIVVAVLLMLALCVVVQIWPGVGRQFGGQHVLMVLALTVLLQQLQMTAQASAINSFFVAQNAVSRVVFAFAFLVAGLAAARQTPPLLWLMVAWAWALIVSTAVLYRSVPGIRVRPRLDPVRSRALLADGFPIFVQGLLRLLMSNVDKLLVWGLASTGALGVYALGTLVSGLTAMFSSIVVRVSLPALLRMVARDTEEPALAGEVKRTLWMALGASMVVASLVGAFAPTFIYIVLPEYRGGYWTTTILACAGAVIGLSQAASDIAMSFGDKRGVLGLTGKTLIALVVAILSAWHLTGSTVAIALVVLGMFALYAGGLVVRCLQMTRVSPDHAVLTMLRMLGGALALTGMALMLTFLQTCALATLGHGPEWVIATNAAVAALVVVLAWLGYRRVSGI